MTIAEIFERFGEDYFRKGEERVIARLLAEGPAQAARFWSSGEPERMQAVLPLLWGEAAAVQGL